MNVWAIKEGGEPKAVPQEQFGVFLSNQSYVVLPVPGEGQQKLYLWAGTDAGKETLAVAAKHASELKTTMDASYLRQQQGQESAEFKQLFQKFEIQTPTHEQDAPSAAKASATPSTVPAATTKADAASPAAEVASDDSKAGDVKEAAGSPASAAAGKSSGPKRGGAKSKPAQPKSAPKTADTPAEQQAVPASAAEASDAAASPAADEQPAQGASAPASEAPAAAGKVAPASDAKAAGKAGVEPAPVATTPDAKPASEEPAKQSAPSTKAASATPPAKAAASDAATSAVDDSTPAQSSAPATGSVEEGGVPSVSKAKEQLQSHLSGTLADPLAQKQHEKDGTRGGKAPTFLADSARAWGGVGSNGGAPASTAVQIKPGDKSFGYDELKGLLADSGIDMTCKEAYLTDAEFEKVFGKDRAAFKGMPAWRQQMAKKDVGLW